MAVRKAHPEITVIGTVGPFNEGSNYDAGWELARRLDIPIVDEHYYVSPGWLTLPLFTLPPYSFTVLRM